MEVASILTPLILEKAVPGDKDNHRVDGRQIKGGTMTFLNLFKTPNPKQS